MLDLITSYYDNSINKRFMPDASISRHEGNSICGDDVTVYLKIGNQLPATSYQPLVTDTKLGAGNWELGAVILDWSYDGNTSMITTAASSFLSELIIGKTLEEVLSMTYENTLLPEGFEVTPRRKRAWGIAILASRNAIHEFLQDRKTDTREDVVDM
jgi:NifU-like protein involved in Fe-S cluster formation